MISRVSPEVTRRSWVQHLAEGTNPYRVLVVDDEPMIRALIRVALGSDERYQLLLAEDGQRALEVAQRMKPDVFILDVRMPKVSGLEVCKALRSDPQSAEATIIMLSALKHDEDIEMGYAAGADLYLTKPFDPDDLQDLVQEALGLAT